MECDGFGGFVAVVDPNGGDGDCTTTCGTEDCAKDHEDYHIAQFKLVCPYACKEPYCHIPVPKGWMVNILNAVCKEKMECQAYKVEIDCLKKKYNDLIGKGTTCTRKDGTMPKCTNYISALIRAKVAQANKDYGCQLVAR